MMLLNPFHMTTQQRLYMRHNFLKNIECFTKFHSLINRENLITHLSPFVFNPLGITFSMSPSDVVKNLGKPIFRVKELLNSIDHKAFFYSNNIGAQISLVQIHFLDNEFWLAKLDIPQQYPEIKGNEINVFEEKYQVKLVNKEIHGYQKILDSHGDGVLMKQSFNAELIYYSQLKSHLKKIDMISFSK